MKSMLLAAATAALLTLNVPTAPAQGACSKAYVGCIDVCVKRPDWSVQDRCITTCQAKNDRCAEKVFGARSEEIEPVKHPGEIDGALARDAGTKRQRPSGR
jgi:hypothetical protein